MSSNRRSTRIASRPSPQSATSPRSNDGDDDPPDHSSPVTSSPGPGEPRRASKATAAGAGGGGVGGAAGPRKFKLSTSSGGGLFKRRAGKQQPSPSPATTLKQTATGSTPPGGAKGDKKTGGSGPPAAVATAALADPMPPGLFTTILGRGHAKKPSFDRQHPPNQPNQQSNMLAGLPQMQPVGQLGVAEFMHVEDISRDGLHGQQQHQQQQRFSVPLEVPHAVPASGPYYQQHPQHPPPQQPQYTYQPHPQQHHQQALHQPLPLRMAVPPDSLTEALRAHQAAQQQQRQQQQHDDLFLDPSLRENPPPLPGQLPQQLEQDVRQQLFKDVATILYVDPSQAEDLVNHFVQRIDADSTYFERGVLPEAQSESGRALLGSLAAQAIELDLVRKVHTGEATGGRNAWPNVGIWLVTKAFDIWTGQIS